MIHIGQAKKSTGYPHRMVVESKVNPAEENNKLTEKAKKRKEQAQVPSDSGVFGHTHAVASIFGPEAWPG
jgi:hypothetical protein